MFDLIVSLDHVSVLREKRRASEPDPVTAAVMAEMAGASGISVNLRADRKHITERDVRLLRELAKTRLYLALAPNTDTVKFAYAIKPDVVSLVPERHEEVSSSIGLDVILNQAQLKKTIRALREVGVRVHILIDPDVDQVKASQGAEADGVILNTRLYADSARPQEIRDGLDRIETAARVARKLQLTVIAGHGLDYANVAAVARCPDIQAFEVGHAIVSRSLYRGLDQAVAQFMAVITNARSGASPRGL